MAPVHAPGCAEQRVVLNLGIPVLTMGGFEGVEEISQVGFRPKFGLRPLFNALEENARIEVSSYIPPCVTPGIAVTSLR